MAPPQKAGDHGAGKETILMQQNAMTLHGPNIATLLPGARCDVAEEFSLLSGSYNPLHKLA